MTAAATPAVPLVRRAPEEEEEVEEAAAEVADECDEAAEAEEPEELVATAESPEEEPPALFQQCCQQSLSGRQNKKETYAGVDEEELEVKQDVLEPCWMTRGEE